MTLPTLRNQIVSAAITALNTGTPSGLPAASRLRLTQFEAADHPAITVYPGTETVVPATNRASPVVRRQLEVILEYRVMGDDPDDLLDPLIGWGSEAMAQLDQTLVNDVIETSLAYKFEAERAVIGLARHVFTVHYQTRRDDQGLAA